MKVIKATATAIGAMTITTLAIVALPQLIIGIIVFIAIFYGEEDDEPRK